MDPIEFYNNNSTYIIGGIVGLIAYLLFAPPKPTSHVVKPTLLESPESFNKVDMVKEMEKDCPKTGKRYAVVGVGFVGRCIVEMLLARGDGDGKNGNSIICIDMMKQNPFESSPNWLHVDGKNFLKPIENLEKRIEYVQADVTKVESLVAALKGKNVDVVFCTAALIAFNHRLDYQVPFSYKVNVDGAKNVCNAMVECGIPHLVFTSTSHVILRSDDKLKKNLSETSPLSTRETSYNHYSWTKAAAEKLVLGMQGTPLKNSNEVLNVVSVRPCSGVYGYGDRFMTQRLATDPMGQVYVASSDRSHIDHIYVNNLVFGELLAEKELIKGKFSAASGQAFNLVGYYCCTENIYRLMQQYWPEGGVKNGEKRFPLHFFMPSRLMEYVVGPTMEFLQNITGGKITPYLGEMALLTPPMFDMVGNSYDCNGDKAKKILKFRDLFSFQEACQRLSWQYCTEDHWKKKK